MTYQTYDEELLCMFYAQKEALRKQQETINKLQETVARLEITVASKVVKYGDSIKFKTAIGGADIFGKTIIKDYDSMSCTIPLYNSMMEE